MATPSKRAYRPSPVGQAIHPWLNKPDTKFDEAGVFKTGLHVPVAEAQADMDRITAGSEGHPAEDTAGMTPMDRKAWTLYAPVEVEEDDNGNRTGFVAFNHKHNATIRPNSGEKKRITIRRQDEIGADNPLPIFGGADIRVIHATRDVKMTSGGQAGVSLDFCGLQVRTYSEGGQAGGGFGAMEGRENEDDGAGDAMPRCPPSRPAPQTGIPEVGRGASSRSPLRYRHIDVFTLPAFPAGGTVAGLQDGMAFTDTVAASTPVKAYPHDIARRDLCIIATGASDGESGYTPDHVPGRGWLCLAAGGYAEPTAHLGEVSLASTVGTTFQVSRIRPVVRLWHLLAALLVASPLAAQPINPPGSKPSVFARTADPTAADIPVGQCADWSTSGAVNRWCNIGGTVKAAQSLTTQSFLPTPDQISPNNSNARFRDFTFGPLPSTYQKLKSYGLQRSMRQIDGSEQLVFQYYGNYDPNESPKHFAQPASVPIKDDGSWSFRGAVFNIYSDNQLINQQVGRVTSLADDGSGKGTTRITGVTIDNNRTGYVAGERVPIAITVEVTGGGIRQPTRRAVATIGVIASGASYTLNPADIVITDGGAGYPADPTLISVGAAGPAAGSRDVAPALVLSRQTPGVTGDYGGMLNFQAQDAAGVNRHQMQMVAYTTNAGPGAAYKSSTLVQGTNRANEFAWGEGLYFPGESYTGANAKSPKGFGSLNFLSGYFDVTLANKSVVTGPSVQSQTGTQAQPAADFSYHNTIPLTGKGITGWTTVTTITSTATGGSYVDAVIDMRVSGSTATYGSGARKASWVIAYQPGATAVKISDSGRLRSGSTPPQVRIVGGPGNSFLIQVAAADTNKILDTGVLEINALLPQAAGSELSWNVSN